MGYNFDLVIKALRTLRLAKKYNPIGEIQKAMDWINDHLQKEEEN